MAIHREDVSKQSSGMQQRTVAVGSTSTGRFPNGRSPSSRHAFVATTSGSTIRGFYPATTIAAWSKRSARTAASTWARDVSFPSAGGAWWTSPRPNTAENAGIARTGGPGIVNLAKNANAELRSRVRPASLSDTVAAWPLMSIFEAASRAHRTRLPTEYVYVQELVRKLSPPSRARRHAPPRGESRARTAWTVHQPDLALEQNHQHTWLVGLVGSWLPEPPPARRHGVRNSVPPLSGTPKQLYPEKQQKTSRCLEPSTGTGFPLGSKEEFIEAKRIQGERNPLPPVVPFSTPILAPAWITGPTERSEPKPKRPPTV